MSASLIEPMVMASEDGHRTFGIRKSSGERHASLTAPDDGGFDSKFVHLFNPLAVASHILNGAADQASRTPPSTGRYDSRMQMLHPSIAT